MKINLTFPIKALLIPILTCLLPLAVHAQQSSSNTGTHVHASILLIGEHPAISEVDAHSAATLIASEFRKHGISIGDPVNETSTTGSIYRVTFRSLGEKILVHLSQENPPGTIIAERQLWISNIEEMIETAPRLVDALVNNKPIDSTIDMESVTEHEAEKLNKISGESLWNVGIIGIAIPGTDHFAEPGYEFGWSYETPKYGIGTEFRGSFGEEFSFGSWSIGGRYFFNKKNIAPYVGGGFSIFGGSYTIIEEKREDRWFSDEPYYYEYHDTVSENGIGAYVVGGISMLRLTKSRLKIELRVDRPYFKIEDQDMMPITIGIFFSQHYVPNRGGCLSF
ncbi:MAG: hypothetical protein OXD54_13775 [Candidatus Poribacteria bacterium]|nr:hypothetical protein [Candidatus Poribacteria bacterium]